MSQFGAKPRGSAFAAAPGLRVGTTAEPVVRFWHGESLKGGGRLFRNVNGFRVFSDSAVAVVVSVKRTGRGNGSSMPRPSCFLAA
ncbi:MAG: hypothetical protein ACM3X3_07170 [Betaproteobacteria bacterium]